MNEQVYQMWRKQIRDWYHQGWSKSEIWYKFVANSGLSYDDFLRIFNRL